MRWPALLRLSPRWAPYVFISPFLILFAVFGVFPLLFSLYLAFQSWEPTSGLDAMEFVGLANFAFAVQDEWFWKSLKNTLWLALAAGVPQHLVAIPLAVFIHTSFKRLRDGVAVAFIVFWRYLGFNLVLYLAALQTIPKDLYEAATMDGAGRLQQFFHITLPSLKPMIFFGVTLSVIGGLQLFEEPFILTGGNGGPDQAGLTSAVYLYRMAFDFNDFGGASAMSWLLFVAVALMTWLTNRAFKPRT
jgi:multiple sugar transport system permease protein